MSCNQNCQQGRACTCAPAPITRPERVAIGLIWLAVALAATSAAVYMVRA